MVSVGRKKKPLRSASTKGLMHGKTACRDLYTFVLTRVPVADLGEEPPPLQYLHSMSITLLITADVTVKIQPCQRILKFSGTVNKRYQLKQLEK